MSKKENGRDVQYDQCPFCDRLFVDRAYVGNGLRRVLLDDGRELYDHIRSDHRKVWVSKGNRGRWMDADHVRKLKEAAERHRNPSI